MLESTVTRELRRALRREGIWGQRATRLLQEWTDHIHESTTQRIADSAAPEAAERAAWQALGTPDILAAQAARQLAQASWLGRRPWLAGLLLPITAWVAYVAILVFVPILVLNYFLESNWWSFVSQGVWRTCEHVFTWLPWLLSLAWLARLARTLPGGWKHYWITAAALTILAPSVQLVIYTHLPGPGPDAMFQVGPVGLPSVVIGIILKLFHALPDGLGLRDAFAFPGTWWIRTAITCACLFALRAWSHSTFDRPSQRPA
jgi:hypothetical protein